MGKKILGSLSLLVGLGLALFLGYHFLLKPGVVSPPAPVSPKPFQGVIRPAPEPAQKPEASAPPHAAPQEAPPTASGPEAAPGLAPVPSPGPPSAEKEIAPLEPKEEQGLLAGRFRRYADAKRLLAKIQKQHMPAFIRKQGKFYQVWAGPFATPQEAEQAKKNLKAALKISSQQEKFEVPVPK